MKLKMGVVAALTLVSMEAMGGFQFRQVVQGLSPGNSDIARDSCRSILDSGDSTGNGVYTITTSGGSDIEVYCDMTADGGGWTLVTAQYENDPVTDWGEGIQVDYDPSLLTKKGFALSEPQLPVHSQTAFGKDLSPTYLDFFDVSYGTGNFPVTRVQGQRTGDHYDIHRYSGGYFDNHNPEGPFRNYSTSQWRNTLTIDRAGGDAYSWAFSPYYSSSTYRGFAMNGVDRRLQSNSFAWTVWVR